MDTIPVETITFCLQHVLWPRKIPSKPESDDRTELHEGYLLSLFSRMLNQLSYPVENWYSIAGAFHEWAHCPNIFLMSSGYISERISTMKDGDIFPMMLRNQNAGLVIIMQADSALVYSFEISFSAENVTKAAGVLRCSYPGMVVSVPKDILLEPDFLNAFSNQVEFLFKETNSNCIPFVGTTGTSTVKVRDTVHPKYVTMWLSHTLAAFGEIEQVPGVTKTIRDDVYWESGTPNRRSFFWTMIKIALHTSLVIKYGLHMGTTLYKTVMLDFLVYIGKLDGTLDSDEIALQLMRKVAIRMKKLSTFGEDQAFVSEALNRAAEFCEATRAILDERHQRVIQAELEAGKLPKLFPYNNDENATKIVLRDLEEMLKNSQAPSISSSSLPITPPDTDSLHLFESTIRKTLLSAKELLDQTYSYISQAKNQYKGNPVANSRMILTAFEAWKQLDTLACIEFNLLKDHKTGIDIAMFSELLLPHRSQMEQLHALENYILERDSNAQYPSIYSTSHSFADRYASQNNRIAELKSEIIQHAEDARDRKRLEFQRLFVEVQRNLAFYQQKRCECSVKTCSRCSAINAERNRKITIHEWPIPFDKDTDNEDTNAFIFELEIPDTLAHLRDLTHILLSELCIPNGKREKKDCYTVNNLFDMKPWYKGKQRFCFLGTYAKPYTLSFPSVTIHLATEQSVLRPHGGREYRLLERQGLGVPISQTISAYCKLQLPDGSYSGLQWTVDSTNHNENQVLANQCQCHPDIPLLEYLAFGTLRCGRRLQWRNILATLESLSVSLSDTAAFVLIAQSIWQTEERNADWTRQAHEEINRNEEFASLLIQTIDKLVSQYVSNWSEMNVYRVLVCVNSRIMELTDSLRVKQEALQVTIRLRRILKDWMASLTNQIELIDELQVNQIAGLRKSLVFVANLGILTFNVENAGALEDMESWLFFSSKFNELAQSKSFSSSLTSLEKILVSLANTTAKHMTYDLSDNLSEALTHFIHRTWKEFARGTYSGWTEFRDNDQTVVHGIFETQFTSSTGVKSQLTVNAVTGQFLVNGWSISKLSESILEHPDYKRVYGSEHIFDVQPSDTSGKFLASQKYHGALLSFSIHHKELYVTEEYENGDQLKLVPYKWLRGLLPTLFTSSYTHWLNVQSHKIEFRPLESSVFERTVSYELDLVQNRLTEHRTQRTMIGIGTDTFKSYVNTIFDRIELPENIHMFIDSNNVISIELPRMNLKFTVENDGTIRSREYEGMFVTDHYLGTLLGLENSLVLTNGSQKMVLIPHGDISREYVNSKTVVRIDRKSLRNPPYFAYNLDLDLEQLQGPTTTEGWLMLAALHAYTSTLYPDPFTKICGYEKAMTLLLTRCRSSNRYSLESTKLLNKMKNLAPVRSYYPKHVNFMQKVIWPENIESILASDAYALICHYLERESVKLDFLYTGNNSSQTMDWIAEMESRPLHIKGYWRDVTPEISFILRSIEEEIGGYPVDTMYEARHFVTQPRVYQLACKMRRNKFTSADCSLNTSTISTLKRADIMSKISVNQHWLSLYHRIVTQRNQMENLFLLTYLMSERKHVEQVPALAIVASNISLFKDVIPAVDTENTYNLSLGHEFDEYSIANTLRKGIPISTEKTKRELLVNEANQVVSKLAEVWKQAPSKDLDMSLLHSFSRNSMQDVTEMVRVWYTNFTICQFLSQVGTTLSLIQTDDNIEYDLDLEEFSRESEPRLNAKTIHYELTRVPLVESMLKLDDMESQIEVELFDAWNEGGKQKCVSESLLANTSESKIDDYLREDLEKSCESYVNQSRGWMDVLVPDDIDVRLSTQLDKLLEKRTELFEELSTAWNQGTSSLVHRAIDQSFLWPKITTIRLLELVVSSDRDSKSAAFRRILQYGLVITQLQRLVRCRRYKADHDATNLKKELFTKGHSNWDPFDYPEWLILEIESNCLVREIQAKIALDLLNSESNRVTQLNMGEGKTSMILPLLALAISDSTRVARVVVLKQLFSVAYEALSFKLGGILNRQMVRLPFHRDCNISEDNLNVLQYFYEKCKRDRSIILSLPEHILSFYLKGLETAYNRENTSSKYLQLQSWIDSNVRDVLDESDELLHIKYQLIYTLGKQLPPDGEQSRWLVAQSVLQLIRKHSVIMSQQFPGQIEYMEQNEPGSFPRLRILEDGNNRIALTLATQIMNDILDGNSIELTIPFNPKSISRKTLIQFVVQESIDDYVIHEVETLLHDDHVFATLLILRGLLGYSTLCVGLSKRWRVNYGVGPRRKMAVPFRAKDVASERTEFGHVDIAIVLTQLSYYYSGLSLRQLENCFEVLFRNPNPAQEYNKWVEWAGVVPDSIKHLTGVNLKDIRQKRDLLYPSFFKNTKVIDFWLNNCVYPLECKQFESKVISNCWDLAKTRKHTTIGFSGTNDTKLLLPSTIEQSDMKELQGTNAMVLDYLLQKENENYFSLPPNVSGMEILRTIKNLQILLDPGALILDMTNEQVAETWLRMSPGHIQAAVYFNDQDELVVRDRNSDSAELLMISPYKQRLKDCVIYLDDCHCRGTDLKFPPNARAALTLGKGMTKDKLVQACMRLRQLGHGQSVHFCASDEVHRVISSTCQTTPQTTDVIRWVFNNTKKMIQDGIMSFATQGLSYYSRLDAVKTGSIEILAERCHESDRLSLKQLYGMGRQKSTTDMVIRHQIKVSSAFKFDKEMYLQNTEDIETRCSQFACHYQQFSSFMEEEQERELETEKEDERQVSRPSPALPHTPSFTLFQQTLSLKSSLLGTSLEPLFEYGAWSNSIQCTKDFVQVIETDQTDSTTVLDYIRPVRYVADVDGKLVLLSMFEANIILEGNYPTVVLHLFVPKIRPNQQTFFNHSGLAPSRSFSFNFEELSLFAGSVYIEDSEEESRILNFLGLCPAPRSEEEEYEYREENISLSGFVSPSIRSKLTITSSFTKDPVPFLQKYIYARTRNDCLMTSPLGNILFKGKRNF